MNQNGKIDDFLEQTFMERLNEKGNPL
jgi:hypothetical protein